MDSYLLLKLLHILSASVITGTGAGIAFFMLMASRSRHPHAIYITARHVILGDWIFTAPAVLTQLITGLLLMNQLDYSFTSPWFFWVIGLFIFIGVCWIPVVCIQYRLRELARCSVEQGDVIGDFKKLMNIWIALGVPAFTALLAIFWLMVFKPFPVV